MKKTSRTVVAALAVLALSSSVADGQTLSAEHRSPHAAAALFVQMLEDSKNRVIVNSRSMKPLIGSAKNEELLADSLAETVARALGARIADDRSIHKCVPNSYVCRLENTDAVITVGTAAISGETATVLLRIQIDEHTGRSRSIHSRDYEVQLTRVGAVWRAHDAKVLAFAR